MNNQSSFTPRLLVKSKDMAGQERLASKISGCIVTSGWYAGKRKCSFYINHDQVFIMNLKSGIKIVITLIV